MKNNYLILFFALLLASSLFSQTTITGTVLDEKNNPLFGVSVYVNNTTKGTTTNEKGGFLLQINQDNFQIIFSYLGYKTVMYKFSSKENYKKIIVKLKPETNVLGEVFVGKTKYDADWKYNLQRFKQLFLGRTLMAEKCKILNPKTLSFYNDFEKKIFKVYAKEPLQIKHKGLGYHITYDFIDFTLQDKHLSYLGYAKYKELKGTKRRQKIWKTNRLKTYKGSRMHFVRSLRNKTLEREGFVVNQFKRVLNPNRPTETQIKRAKELLKLNGGIVIGSEVINPKTPIDSAKVIMNKIRLPKYRDYLYKRNVPYNEMMMEENNIKYLQFKDYLSIIYTKEPEEENYLLGNVFSKRKKTLGVQTSALVLVTQKAVLDASGDIIEPLDIFVEGYWAFKQFADLLPLNYKPK